ncbi:MAG: glutamine synthetase III [Rikenellaceae bacterium]
MSLRFKMVEQAIARKAQPVVAPEGRPADYYGQNVFNQKKMLKYLPHKTYTALMEVMKNQGQLSPTLAESVAAGMKQWALEMGATHYTHWFQPLTGGTAEKHDAFIEHDGFGGLLEEFSGKLLSQQEGDASSFPNGGTRSTFEARGYSAWDPTSPAFIDEDTLCIPTVFISYTGEALDFKTPLLKSIGAVTSAATAVCQMFDPEVKKVTSFLGWEQEYFLVDEGLWAARPDLVLTGRTLMGHESAKNQQLEDHYFGAIPTRVAAFMKELEFECWKMGIPAKTRHNEVAPGQFEIAPVYEEANLANDHNLLLMSIMRKLSRKHCFRIILHEKPFKGINGSGKHNNWSLGTDTGVNLFSPAKTDSGNLQFVTFLANTLMAVYRHNGMLKASISNATNAHRLGANEAPPAIISVFLGAQISELFEKIENSDTEEVIKLSGKSGFKLGLPQIPEIFLDNTDRNRTSPFAFTGNRFEFRAVGSTANCGGTLTVLNTAVAEQLVEFKAEVDALIESGMAKEKAIFTIVKKTILACKAIHFDGNGYSDQWKKEAAERGLDCEGSVPLILENYLSESTVAMFEKVGVMTQSELHARAEVAWEMYTKKIQIEARVLGDLIMNHILPVASSYQAELLDKVYKINSVFDAEKSAIIGERDMLLIEKISNHMRHIRTHVDRMVAARREANVIESEQEKAVAYHDTVATEVENIRYYVDKLELIVDNEKWTLPKYRELLFLR